MKFSTFMKIALVSVIAVFTLTAASHAEMWQGGSANSPVYTMGSNVGIGTATPISKLSVNGQISLMGDYPYLKMDSNDKSLTLSGGSGYSETGALIVLTGSTASVRPHEIEFHAGGIERMRLTTNGLLGIGTKSPKSALHVDGQICLSGAYPYLKLDSNDKSLTLSGGSGYSGTGALIVLKGSTASVRPHEIEFHAGGIEKMRLTSSGRLGIGTKSPASELAVNGTITAKEVRVTNAGWADYVFAEGYDLKPLDQVETFIKINKHLPEMPSESEIKANGLPMAEMMAKQMAKIEELTLYMIELKKENQALKARVQALEQ